MKFHTNCLILIGVVVAGTLSNNAHAAHSINSINLKEMYEDQQQIQLSEPDYSQYQHLNLNNHTVHGTIFDRERRSLPPSALPPFGSTSYWRFMAQQADNMGYAVQGIIDFKETIKEGSKLQLSKTGKLMTKLSGYATKLKAVMAVAGPLGIGLSIGLSLVLPSEFEQTQKSFQKVYEKLDKLSAQVDSLPGKIEWILQKRDR
eukprot:Pgem_evm1s5673